MPNAGTAPFTGKVEKVSLNWAKLIARIYEVNPLVCKCGKEIKITAFVMNSAQIWRILNGIGWPTEIPELDPPYDFDDFSDLDICQLIHGTKDGFPEDESGPDPPHWDDCNDPPLIAVTHPIGTIDLHN